MLDPAFMRRIQTKIRVGSPSDEEFCEIFRRLAADHGVEVVDQDLLDELISLIRDTLKQELRQCYPRDLIDQICWKARYEGRPLSLDRASLRRAVNTYFLQSV